MPNKILYIDVRRGVTAACWAHNPEVAGSSPAVATKSSLNILKRLGGRN